LQHFLNDAHDSAKTAKRSANLVPMDAIQNEDFQIENTDNWSAENRFDAGWAVTVSQRALDHLREECVRAGREKVFTVLSPFLAIDIDDWNYQKAAEVLGVPGSSTRTLVNRLRERYRSLLRAEVAETVCEPAAIEDELRYLHRLLVGGIA
jgi:RNA polymerase sigma-70 factor (ECF subfamily)